MVVLLLTPLTCLPPKPTTNTEEPTKHKVFYQNQFSGAYKTDQRVIRNNMERYQERYQEHTII